MCQSFLLKEVLQLFDKTKTAFPKNRYTSSWVIGGYVLMIISTLCIIFAYRGVDYKNGPVVESLGFVLVMIFGRVFFREKLSQKKILGMCLVIAGIAVFYLV